jgi:tetratricopeptide (TPR) repeat protein
MSRRRKFGSRCLQLFLHATFATVVTAQALAAPVEEASEPDDSLETVSEPPGYRAAVEEAVREFAARNYEESRSMFNRAHVVFPNARTYRGLGLTEFELRNYGECIKHFEAALHSTVRPLTEDLRADTERMLARAYNFVARVVVDTEPDVSSVVLDGLPVELPVGQALLLRVGEHTLEIQAVGFVPATRELNVKGGEDETVTIILERRDLLERRDVERKDLERRDAPALKPRERVWYKSPWLWTAVGVAAVGAAAATGVALSRDPDAVYGGTSKTVGTAP